MNIDNYQLRSMPEFAIPDIRHHEFVRGVPFQVPFAANFDTSFLMPTFMEYAAHDDFAIGCVIEGFQISANKTNPRKQAFRRYSVNGFNTIEIQELARQALVYAIIYHRNMEVPDAIRAAGHQIASMYTCLEVIENDFLVQGMSEHVANSAKMGLNDLNKFQQEYENFIRNPQGNNTMYRGAPQFQTPQHHTHPGIHHAPNMGGIRQMGNMHVPVQQTMQNDMNLPVGVTLDGHWVYADQNNYVPFVSQGVMQDGTPIFQVYSNQLGHHAYPPRVMQHQVHHQPMVNRSFNTGHHVASAGVPVNQHGGMFVSGMPNQPVNVPILESASDKYSRRVVNRQAETPVQQNVQQPIQTNGLPRSMASYTNNQPVQQNVNPRVQELIMPPVQQPYSPNQQTQSIFVDDDNITPIERLRRLEEKMLQEDANRLAVEVSQPINTNVAPKASEAIVAHSRQPERTGETGEFKLIVDGAETYIVDGKNRRVYSKKAYRGQRKFDINNLESVCFDPDEFISYYIIRDGNYKEILAKKIEGYEVLYEEHETQKYFQPDPFLKRHKEVDKEKGKKALEKVSRLENIEKLLATAEEGVAKPEGDMSRSVREGIQNGVLFMEAVLVPEGINPRAALQKFLEDSNTTLPKETTVTFQYVEYDPVPLSNEEAYLVEKITKATSLKAIYDILKSAGNAGVVSNRVFEKLIARVTDHVNEIININLQIPKVIEHFLEDYHAIVDILQNSHGETVVDLLENEGGREVAEGFYLLTGDESDVLDKRLAKISSNEYFGLGRMQMVTFVQCDAEELSFGLPDGIGHITRRAVPELHYASSSIWSNVPARTRAVKIVTTDDKQIYLFESFYQNSLIVGRNPFFIN